MSNSTARPPRSGYDLPVYGLADGLLLNIHVPAILCITISLLCAVATVAWSVRSHWVRGRGARFFDWTQGERNIVYLAVCDGCFNLAHLFDHAHYLLLRDHHLLVNLIAVSACVTIHRERMVEWGARDWRQLLYTFGGSLLIDIGCPGDRSGWRSAGRAPCSAPTCKPQEAAPQAARTGMLFVSAFFIQWWTSVLWGLWQLFEPPPVLLHHLTTTFCNLGGALNFGVFYILRRRRRRRHPADSLRQQRSEDRGDSTGRRCGRLPAQLAENLQPPAGRRTATPRRKVIISSEWAGGDQGRALGRI
ncbi:hypothetical protein FJT64_013581 [Amphibalanus amphitrite]|uniref:Uncharacterized protein n=1 Tax=Amphibalanus amphitrite TaxID=1232801 RepID=A0A6A4VC73_AMPAM|nr:hypothetical protein FJT64_013581 [Amphibalanus amphitrite]